MDPPEIEAIIAERLERWGRFLREQHATPSAIIALGHPGARRDRFEIVLTCPEGIRDEQIVQQLQAALALLRHGEVHYR